MFSLYKNKIKYASVPLGYLTTYNQKTSSDLLGYRIKEEGFSLSPKTQAKAFREAKWRYAQGGLESLLSYLKRWRTWGQAGLLFKIHDLEIAVLRVKGEVMRHSHPKTSKETEHGRLRRKAIPQAANPGRFSAL